MSVLLITNMKSHTGFRLILTSMTLNDLKQCNNPYFAFLTNLIALPTNYITVVEDRPIVSINIVSQFQSYSFGHN